MKYRHERRDFVSVAVEDDTSLVSSRNLLKKRRNYITILKYDTPSSQKAIRYVQREVYYQASFQLLISPLSLSPKYIRADTSSITIKPTIIAAKPKTKAKTTMQVNTRQGKHSSTVIARHNHVEGLNAQPKNKQLRALYTLLNLKMSSKEKRLVTSRGLFTNTKQIARWRERSIKT